MSAYETEFVRSKYDTTPLEGCGEYIGSWSFITLQGSTQRIEGQPELVNAIHGGDVTTVTLDDWVESGSQVSIITERMDISASVEVGNASNLVETRLIVPGGVSPWTTEGVYNVLQSDTYPFTQTPESGEHPTGGSVSVLGRDIYVFCDPGDMIEN